MKKQLFLSLITLLLIVSTTLAQSTEIDSLKNELIDLPQDTNRLNILMELSGKLYRVDPDDGIAYSQQAIDLATRLDRKEDLGYALKNIGLAHYFKSEFSDVLLYWQESLDAFKAIDHTKGISNLLNNLGAVYYSQGNNPQALEYYAESLKFAEKINDQERLATAYVNIGAVYAEDPDTYAEARENYQKALDISERTGSKDAIGTTALNLAELYLHEKNPKAALTLLDKALTTFEEIKGNVSNTQNLIGQAHMDLGDLPKAIELHKQAIATAKRDQTDLELSQAYIKLGNALNAQGDHKSAITAYTNGLQTAEIFDGNNERFEAYKGLSTAHQYRGQYKSAFEYQTQLTELRETMRSDENEERMGQLRIQFDIANKEKEIALLNSENELKAAQIEKDNIFQNFLLAIGGLLLLLLGGIFYQYRYVQKSHARLAIERNRAEDILLNILPKDTADELKEKGHVDSREYDQTTVMFTDFKGFTQISQTVPGNQLVSSIDYYFKKFDQIISKFNLEKIKTIGDSYMCAGGLPTANKSNPIDAIMASLEIMKFVKETHANPPEGIHPFEVRIGMNTGPLVAGVVGTKKFQYDIWGSTVNIASRMESSSEEGKINISENTYQLIKNYFECKYRGEIEVKNAGLQKMYYVENALPLLSTVAPSY